MIWNQRNYPQALGNGPASIADYGCYLTAYTMVANHFGEAIDPLQMNQILLDNGKFIDGDLLSDNALDGLWGNLIHTAEVLHYEGSAADLNQLSRFNGYSDECILELDFDHNPNDGIQTHFVRFVSWDGTTLMIDDPWFGSEDNFALHYGSAPAETILKMVHLQGPPAPAAQPQSSEDVPASVVQEPLPVPAPLETPAPPAPGTPPQSDSAPAAAETAASDTSFPADSPPQIVPPPVDPLPSPQSDLPPDFQTVPLDPPSDNSNASSLPPTPEPSQPHNNGMNQITSRLVSRKLWLAVAGVITALINGDVNAAIWVILAYLGVQGAIDHKNAGSN